MICVQTVCQRSCGNLQQPYLELQKSYGDEPYMVEKIGESSTTSVYNTFLDSEVDLADK